VAQWPLVAVTLWQEIQVLYLLVLAQLHLDVVVQFTLPLDLVIVVGADRFFSELELRNQPAEEVFPFCPVVPYHQTLVTL